MAVNDLHARGMLPAIVNALVRVTVADVLESNCRDIYAYWDGLRGARVAPTWADFHLEHLSSKTIPFVRVVDIRTEPFDIRYRYWGTGLVRVLGHDRTGQTLSSMSLQRVQQAIEEYRTVVAERAPYALVYNATTSKETGALYVPGIRLPIMDDGENVTKVVAYADFDANQEKWGRLLAERSRD